MTAPRPHAPGGAGGRDLDVVLVGATGYTGRAVARHLASRAGDGVRWGIAGRRRDALEALAATLGARPEIVEVDLRDPARVRALAERTRAVATTAGPFGVHGVELVAACARAGTHYADITGELPFVRDTIDRWHAVAASSGARVVHACGYDSIPADLGVWLLQRRRAAAGRAPAARVGAYIRSKGGLSGGTAASALAILDAVAERPGAPALPSPLFVDRPRTRAGVWYVPGVMTVINVPVVHRTNHLLGNPWGADFEYSEWMRLGRGLRGAARARVLAGALRAGWPVITRVGAVRRLAARLLPAPGEGPNDTRSEQGFFAYDVVADGGGSADDEAADALAGEGARLLVEGEGDPGYSGTAKMLAEAALCLAFDPLQSPGGVLTPAVAMGDFLAARLRAVGVRVG